MPPSRFAGSSSLPRLSMLLRLNLALPFDPRDDDVRPSLFSSSVISSAQLARDDVLGAPAPSDDIVDERRPAAHATLPTHVDDERWRENLGPRGGYPPV